MESFRRVRQTHFDPNNGAACELSRTTLVSRGFTCTLCTGDRGLVTGRLKKKKKICSVRLQIMNLKHLFDLSTRSKLKTFHYGYVWKVFVNTLIYIFFFSVHNTLRFKIIRKHDFRQTVNFNTHSFSIKNAYEYLC